MWIWKELTNKIACTLQYMWKNLKSVMNKPFQFLWNFNSIVYQYYYFLIGRVSPRSKFIWMLTANELLVKYLLLVRRRFRNDVQLFNNVKLLFFFVFVFFWTSLSVFHAISLVRYSLLYLDLLEIHNQPLHRTIGFTAKEIDFIL